MTINRALGRWYRDLIYRLSSRSVVRGLEVRYFMATDPEDRAGWSKVQQAVEVLATYDLRRLERAKRDLRGILVVAVGGDGEYWRGQRLCVLDDRPVKSDDVTPFSVAGTIAHEAMHARLFHAGFGYGPGNRNRVERVCCKAELDFGQRLPPEDGRPVVERAQARLAQDPEQLWSDAAVAGYSADRLRKLGMPQWFIRLAMRIRHAA
jgi:hypothetical protein